MSLTRRIALLLLAFALIEAVLFLFVDLPLSAWLRGEEAIYPGVFAIFHNMTDYAKSQWTLWPSGLALLICTPLLRWGKLAPPAYVRLLQLTDKLLFFFASIAVSGIVTDIIKPILGRARPVEWLRDGAYGFHPLTFHAAWNGMPSGHATTAAAFATSLTLIAPRGRWLWLGIGLFFGLSRIMVNAHYLSDVLAGSAVGILTTLWLARYRDHQGMFPLMKGIFPIDKAGERG